MHPQRGLRHFGLGPRLWIDRADFEAEPSKGFRRLAPGRRVRLKYGLIVECTGFQRAAGGEVESVQARIVPGSRSGTPGADAHKVSATITWLAQHDAVAAELHLLEPLFGVERPDEGEADFRSLVNPDSRRIARGFVEPTLATAGPGHHVQLERLGYFVADLHRHRAGTPVFNRSTALRSSLPG